MWSSADRLWSQLAAARKRRFPRAARGEEVILGRNAPHLRSEFCLSGALIPSCLLGLRLGPSSPRSRRRKAACSRASPLASNTGRIERLRSQLASAVKWRRLSRSALGPSHPSSANPPSSERSIAVLRDSHPLLRPRREPGSDAVSVASARRAGTVERVGADRLLRADAI